MEIVFTSIQSLLEKNYKLTAKTSVWMFFIYGMVVFFEPLSQLLNTMPIMVRGFSYMCCIFLVEYITGRLLWRFDICPWDYSKSRYHVHGVIRLDYAPLWFIAGLFFESLIGKVTILNI